MTLPLELGGIHDPTVRRALEQLSQQFPIVVTGGGGGGAPSGPAGGVLGGTYPNPGFAADMATQAELDTHTGLTTTAHGGIVASSDARLTDARTPTAHHTTHEPGGTDAMAVDAAAATGSLRTLGTGAAQAAAGNDARLTDSRAPNGAAGGDLSGTYPNPQILAGAIVNADVNAAAAIAESKLSLATDAAAGTGSRRTLGTTATSAAAGNRGLPVGGSSTQVLTKNTATDYDVGWTTPAVGAAPTYDALQQGVVLAGDCALTVNTTAQVTIAAGTVYAPVSGVLTRFAPGSTVLSGIAATAASNFRLDQVVMSTSGVVSILTGTASTTPTLANRTGAAAIGTNKLLHDILVTSGGVLAANVRDRRSWARGAYNSIVRTTNDAAGSNYTTASATAALISATNLQARFECSGVSMRATIRGSFQHSAAGAVVSVGIFLDGAVLNGGLHAVLVESSAAGAVPFFASWDFTPAVGSHLVGPAWSTSTATALLNVSATLPIEFTVEEIGAQNANNGTT